METKTMRTTAALRNVAFVGHGATGKTTLVEHLLEKTGAIKKAGTVQDGTTVSDNHADEKERKISIETSIMSANYNDCELQIFDAPGYPDFVGEAVSALYGVETAMITIDAVDGIAVNTRKMFAEAGKLGIARVLVVTKMDAENASYTQIMEAITAAFGERCAPFVVPDGEGPSFKGIVSVLNATDIPDGVVDSVEKLEERLVERIVEVDDEALMNYLEGERPAAEDLERLAKDAIAQKKLVPVLFVSAEKDAGVAKLLEFMEHYMPSPDQGRLRHWHKSDDDEEGTQIEPDPSAPVRAQVVRVFIDPFVGKVTTLRIHSGTLTGDSAVHNPRGTDKAEKLGHLYRPMGKEQEEVSEAIPGDIVQFTKHEHYHLGDTLCDANESGHFPKIDLPMPMVSFAVEPKKRGDEVKVGAALGKIDESDPSLTVLRSEQTGELVLSVMSALHLDIVNARLAKAGVEIETKPPRIPYLETINAKGDAKYRHKKQSGGAGQFAEVWLRVTPRERGEGFEFKNSIVGGAISASFVGSAEKGIRQVLDTGVLAGYPVVDVLVEVYDGKEHPVDSKDIAFQVAGRNAFKEAFLAAKPSLLEPVVEIEVMVPPQYIGDITGDISGRRGRVQGTDQEGDMQVIKALVPQSEVANYSTELRSMTAGAGSYSMRHSHYDNVPGRLAEPIIAAWKKDDDDKD